MFLFIISKLSLSFLNDENARKNNINVSGYHLYFFSTLFSNTNIFLLLFVLLVIFYRTASQMDIYVNVLSVIDFQGKTIVVKNQEISVKYLINFLDDFHKILQYTTYKT